MGVWVSREVQALERSPKKPSCPRATSRYQRSWCAPCFRRVRSRVAVFRMARPVGRRVPKSRGRDLGHRIRACRERKNEAALAHHDRAHGASVPPPHNHEISAERKNVCPRSGRPPGPQGLRHRWSQALACGERQHAQSTRARYPGPCADRNRDTRCPRTRSWRARVRVRKPLAKRRETFPVDGTTERYERTTRNRFSSVVLRRRRGRRERCAFVGADRPLTAHAHCRGARSRALRTWFPRRVMPKKVAADFAAPTTSRARCHRGAQ
jgi:hypothetical protein